MSRAEVGKSKDGFAADIFYVTDMRSGKKLDDDEKSVENIRLRLYRIVAFALGIDIQRWSDGMENSQLLS